MPKEPVIAPNDDQNEDDPIFGHVSWDVDTADEDADEYDCNDDHSKTNEYDGFDVYDNE